MNKNYDFSVNIKKLSNTKLYQCKLNVPITMCHVCYTHKSIIIVYTGMILCKVEVVHHDFVYITLYVMYEVNLCKSDFINCI